MHINDDLELLSDGCIALNLRRAARIATRRYEEALRPFDLTSFQFSCLRALYDRDIVPHAALAEGFGMDLSTVTRNVRPLVKRGLVRSGPSATDGRVKVLQPTEAGRALFTEALPAWAGAQRRTLADLGEETWPGLRASLRAIGASPSKEMNDDP